jgi:hypothetical protein
MTRPDPGLDQQGSVRSAIRAIGPVLIGVGALLTLGGLADFFAAFGTFQPPRNFWMAFVGLPTLAIGVAITKYAYLGPAARYVAGETTPVLRDALGALGLGEQDRVCAACGARNDAGSRFCDACGKPLARECGACGAANDASARFCSSCGQALSPGTT